jgi:hypothetical protein
VSRARQDEISRARRLRAGCCPTHGLPLTQVGLADECATLPPDRGTFVAACSRRDCGFIGQTHGPGERAWPLAEHERGPYLSSLPSAWPARPTRARPRTAPPGGTPPTPA